VTYARGGGTAENTSGNGAANTGNGGGGIVASGNGNGGSGIVIVRYAAPYYYYDTDGGTGGLAGGAGSWGDSVWSLDQTGAATTGGFSNTARTAVFNSAGSSTVSVAGTQTAAGLIVNQGTVILSNGGSGNIDLGGGTALVGSGATLGGNATITGNTAISGTLAPGNSPGTLNVTGNLTFNAASIFEWELDATNGADPGVVANSGTYDRVIATGDLTGSGAVFEVVLGSNDFSDAFWDSNKTWTNIFTAGNSFDLASIFTSFSGAGVDSSGAVSGQGSFSLSGNTLSWNWAVIPELGNAAAGLLLAAGLLCRRRPAGLATTPPPRNDRDGSKPGLARDLDPDPRRC
jgi:hypothetical protein